MNLLIRFGATIALSREISAKKISILLSRVLLRILIHGQLRRQGVKLDGMAKCRNLLLQWKFFILVFSHGWQFLIFSLEVVQVRDFARYKKEAMSKYQRRCFWKSNNRCAHLLPTSWGSHQRQFQRNKACRYRVPNHSRFPERPRCSRC